MTLFFGPLGVGKFILLFTLANKLDFDLEVKTFITPKFQKKFIYRPNKSLDYRLGEMSLDVGKSVFAKIDN